MSDSGENKPSGQNIQIILALIGLLGAVSSGVFANWDKIFPTASAPPVAVESPSVASTVSTTDGVPVEPAPAAIPSSETTSMNSPAEVATAEVVATVNESVPQSLDLSGTWNSPMLGTTEIKQDGNTVRGSYRTQEHYGAFEGSVVENRLEYRWWQDDKRKSSYEKADTRGIGFFTIEDRGRTLVGNWESETGTRGEWSLTKQD